MNAEDVERAVSTLPSLRHTVFPGTGHMIHDEHPDQYVQALQDFVSSIE